MKYISSDFHLDHTLMIKLGIRPFSSLEEMNNIIIQNLLNVLKPGDQFYFLGDLSWSKKGYYDFFNQWPKNVEFHWILGNHDKKQYKQYKHFASSISDIKEIYIGNKQPVTLCHYPMLTWNKSHYNAFMLYGHHHVGSNGTDKLNNLIQGKMLNVNCEMYDYKPWSENEILEYMEKKPDNWDLIKKDK